MSLSERIVSHPVGRELTEEEVTKLLCDVNLVSEFKQNKLEIEAQKNWDLFYKRNTTKFFKDRHWTKREFKEFSHSLGDCCTVLEVGCGVGNFIFPLLEENPSLVFYACDFSPRAIDFVKSHPLYSAGRCTAFQCDITKDLLTDTVPESSVDVATLIFVLSAIHPDKMVEAVRNVAKILKPGGVLLVRDYGLYDHAMLRFAKGHKLSDCFYVRQDGTRAYYFSTEKLNSIMESSGLKTLQNSYVQRSTVNKKEGIDVSRIFVQGRFSKCTEQDLHTATFTSLNQGGCNHGESNFLCDGGSECVQKNIHEPTCTNLDHLPKPTCTNLDHLPKPTRAVLDHLHHPADTTLDHLHKPLCSTQDHLHKSTSSTPGLLHKPTDTTLDQSDCDQKK